MNKIFPLLVSTFLVVSLAAADWPMFHGDLERTGYSAETTTAGLVEQWQVDLGSPVYTSPVIVQDVVYISTADATLYALNLADGSQVWEIPLDSWLEAPPTVLDDRLYLGCVDHNVYCLNAADGSEIWQTATESWVESSPLVFDDKIYIGSMDHYFYGFNATDGSQLFALQSEYDVRTNASTDGQNVYYAGDDEQIHAITGSGIPLWNVEAGGAVYGAPVYIDGKVIYGSIANGAGLSDNYLAALDAATGNTLWQVLLEEYDFLYDTPAVGYGNVYIGGFQGSVYAYDLETGNQVWTRSLGDWALMSSPALSNGVLYIGSNDGSIYALDALTGVVLDSHPLNGFVQSSPAVSERTLVVGSAAGIVQAFNLDSAVEAVVTSSNPTVAPGQMLDLDIEFNELEGQNQDFFGWVTITRPNGQQRNYGGPIAFSLTPGQQMLINGGLYIPTYAPEGNYWLTINAGPSSDLIWDASSLAFTIGTATGLVGTSNRDWQVVLDGETVSELTAPPEQPQEFALHPAYPNPFNPSTMLSYALPQAGNVSLKLYNAAGGLVRTIADGHQSAGTHQVRIDATGLASGIYFVRLNAGQQTAYQRIVLTK